MNIRAFETADAEAIASIYNHYIEQTVITFEEVPVGADEMLRRATEYDLPWLVLIDEGQVCGYCYASPWSGRSAYRYSVETSVYLAPTITGKGFGKVLLSMMLEMLQKNGICTVLAGIALPNAASVGLHEKLGFSKVAHLKSVGFKQQRWVDVGYWQRLLVAKDKIIMRDYRSEDAAALTDIFYETIHQRGTEQYSKGEVNAWAPLPIDYDYWQQRLDALPPFVAEFNGVIVGFTTLTPEGHIEWTYTHKDYLGQGIGSLLQEYLEEQALVQGLTRLTVDASRFARPMFEKFGFEVIQRNLVERHGERLENWSMQKMLEITS